MPKQEEDPRVARLGFKRDTQIKGYRLADTEQNASESVRPLGLGGSSVVYTVYQELNAERQIYVPRALKLFVMREDLNPEDADTSFVPADSNFLEEIITVSQLTHENLVQVTDAGEFSFVDSDGKQRRLPYIVSHLVTGCTLRDIIESNENSKFARKKLEEEPEQAVFLLSQIARGLGYLHSRGFLHCDIAPKNIFIEDGQSLRAIVGDVGMSRRIDRVTGVRVFIAGTRSYCPESISPHFGTEVEEHVLAGWFPYWDLFALTKTAQVFLEYLETISPNAWVRAAVEKARSAHAKPKQFKSAAEFSEVIEYCLPIHRQRGGVPELEPNAVLSRKRMMPIDPLSLTPRIDSLVRHPALTRLQNVPQLTIVRSASPGGSHSRYEHSLGVMENVRRMLSTLIDEPTFLGILGKNSIETGLVAAVMYNAHRFPFSNVIHELNKRLPPGESKVFKAFGRSELLAEVLGDGFTSYKGLTLPQQIAADFPSVDLEKLRRILTSNSVSELPEPDESVLYTLLNSSLDARVIDFVRRDSLHLGLSGGSAFDLDDLLPHLTISPVSKGGQINQVTLKLSGVSIAEQIILMRYWLYQRVYWNQPNRAYNAAVRRALLDLQSVDGFEEALRERALHLDEGQTLAFLHAFAAERNLTSTRDLLNLIRSTEKVLYREVFVRSLRQCESDPILLDAADLGTLMSRTMSYRTMRQYEDVVAGVLSSKVTVPTTSSAPAVLLDVPFEPGNIKLGADIFVSVPSSSNHSGSDLRSLDKVSPIIDGVNNNFTNDLQRLRILVRRDIATDNKIGAELYAELRRAVTA